MKNNTTPFPDDVVNPIFEKKLKIIRQSLEETKKIMNEDIHHLLDRGEKLEKLNEEAQALEEASQIFFTENKEINDWLKFRKICRVISIVAGCAISLYAWYLNYWWVYSLLSGIVGGLGVTALGELGFSLYQKIRNFSWFNFGNSPTSEKCFSESNKPKSNDIENLPSSKNYLNQFSITENELVSEVNIELTKKPTKWNCVIV